MQYYSFDKCIPARRKDDFAPREIYAGNGNWTEVDDPEKWDMNAQEISEAQFNYLMATTK